jgi:putative PIN family toxin of toxin-antitoxin system
MSGIFFVGPPYRILQAWRDDRVRLVACPEILGEYRQVALRLARKYPGVDILPLIDLVIVRSEIVHAPSLPKSVCDDPKDDILLACALEGKTQTIVSGDRHLLKVSGFAGIQVFRPKAFVDTCL